MIGRRGAGPAAVIAALWLPSLAWLWMVYRLEIALALTGLLGYLTVSALRNAAGDDAAARPLPWRQAAVILFFALGWSAFTGLAHVFTINTDWFSRLEIVDQFRASPWQRLHADGQDYFLRFPGAYYALTALFGGIATTGVLRMILFIATALSCAIALARLFGKTAGRTLAGFLFVIVCINGFDILGVALPALRIGVPLPPFGSHVEWWSGLQYTGLTTAMVWVPNHLLPALLFCSLLPLARENAPRSMARVELLALAAAGTMLWSPLVFLGTLPLIFAELAATVRTISWRRCIAELRPAYVASLLLVMVAITWYLTLDAGSIRKGLYFQSCGAAWLRCSGWFAFFFVAEAIPLAWLCTRLSDRWLGGAAAITLLVLPLFIYGASNDLTMRASFPAIIIAAVSLLQMIEREQKMSRKVIAYLLVLVAGYSSASELWRGVKGWHQEAWQPKGLLLSFQQSFPESLVNGYPPHYMLPAGQACAGLRGQLLRGCGH